MRTLRICLVAIVVAACGGAAEDDFLDCDGKCDAVGPLTVSRTWVPVSGFVRAVVTGGHEVAVTPTDGVTVSASGNRYNIELGRAGFYDVAAKKGGQTVAQVRVRVSDERPAFTVGAPAAGAFVTAADGAAVEVRGTVADPLGGTLTLEMGGRPVTVDAQGGFRASQPARFGVNFVEVTAIDGAKNRFVYHHGFVVAPRYGRGETLADAAMSEELLDLVAEKISPLIPSLIQIGAQAEPVADPLAHKIYFDGATLPGQDGNPGSMVVTLDSREGALRTTLGATGDLVARAHVDNWVLDDTHITATASDLFVDATASFGGGGLAASVDDLTVDFSNFDLEIGSIPGWLPGLFVEAAKSVIGRVIKGRVGPIVTDVLASVGGDYPLTSVPCLELPEPFVLTYRLAAIAPKERRLGVRLGAEAHHGGSGGQGAPMRDEAGVAAPAGGPMAVGVGYNLLNQFLFELWRGGALKITLDEGDLAAALPSVPALAGLDVILDVKAELGLPPVVEAGEGGKLRVSVGEIRVDIKLDAGVFQIALAVNVGAVAAVELSIADGAPRVAVAIEELHFDLGRKTFSGLNPEAVRQLVAAIAPELVGRVAGALEAFKLPAVDLTQVGVAGVRIGIDSGTVRAAAGGVAFSGTISVLTDPPAPSAGPGCAAPLN